MPCDILRAQACSEAAHQATTFSWQARAPAMSPRLWHAARVTNVSAMTLPPPMDTAPSRPPSRASSALLSRPAYTCTGTSHCLYCPLNLQHCRIVCPLAAQSKQLDSCQSISQTNHSISLLRGSKQWDARSMHPEPMQLDGRASPAGRALPP